MVKIRYFIQNFGSPIREFFDDLRRHGIDEIILFDTSTLLKMFYECPEKLRPLVLFLSEWKRARPPKIGCIPDFIALESGNAERLEYGDTRVRKFLKDLTKRRTGLYTDLRTPIRRVKADHRSTYLNGLPKRYRHLIIKHYQDLSGTDIALIITAQFLYCQHETSIAITSCDGTLLRAAEEIEVTPYRPEALCKILTDQWPALSLKDFLKF